MPNKTRKKMKNKYKKEKTSVSLFAAHWLAIATMVE